MTDQTNRFHWTRMRPAFAATIVLAAVLTQPASTGAQQGRGNQPPPPPPTLGLDQGTLEFDTPAFTLRLVKASKAIAALEPKGVPTYTPTPSTGRGRGGRGGQANEPPQPTG